MSVTSAKLELIILWGKSCFEVSKECHEKYPASLNREEIGISNTEVIGKESLDDYTVHIDTPIITKRRVQYVQQQLPEKNIFFGDQCDCASVAVLLDDCMHLLDGLRIISSLWALAEPLPYLSFLLPFLCQEYESLFTLLFSWQNFNNQAIFAPMKVSGNLPCRGAFSRLRRVYVYSLRDCDCKI